MRSLKVCSAVIYFMAKGERLTRKQVFGNQGNPVYAIWPFGCAWCAAYHDGKRWDLLTAFPARSERDAYDYVAGHYFNNF